MIERRRKATFSKKHLNRYVGVLPSWHDTWNADRFMQSRNIVSEMVGTRLHYNELVTNCDLETMARA